MITLMTGLPGNGKTLFALWYIKAKSEKEHREVYYHNIKDLALPWTETDPENWMTLPANSILVIDECQDVFPKKPNGSKLPEFYSELAKHRHRGIDIYLITQHPSLIDNFVRQLVGQHFHSVRKFGLARSTIYEWSAANASPQSLASQKSSIQLKFPYPKKAFTWYKSAEVHTVKRSIPAKVILAVLFVLSVIGVIYYALNSYKNRGQQLAADSSLAAGVAGGRPFVVDGRARSGFAAGLNGDGKPVFDPVSDARNYVNVNTPRIAGLPQTAPKYDQLTVPSRVPVPAMCIQRKAKAGPGVTCNCFTQQGTPMNVDPLMCVGFARDGFFQDFDADRDRIAQERTSRGVQAISGRPDDVPKVEHSAAAVAFIPDTPYVSRLSGAPAAPARN